PRTALAPAPNEQLFANPSPHAALSRYRPNPRLSRRRVRLFVIGSPLAARRSPLAALPRLWPSRRLPHFRARLSGSSRLTPHTAPSRR
ncbi:hypothetical protein KDL01_41735, partial [Actinospica durhamensis]